MNIWGHCEGCDTWFPCPIDTEAEWRCQVCDIEPLRIENRGDVAHRRAYAPSNRPTTDEVVGGPA